MKSPIAALLLLVTTLSLGHGPAKASAGQAANVFPGVLAGLVDQDGRGFDPGSVRGRLVLVNFIFTGCGSTCPTQTAHLVQLRRTLPAPVRDRLTILSISVDPANDDPATLRTYAKSMGIADRRWRLLTGSLPDILRVTRAFAAIRPDVTSQALHSSEVRLFDARGRMLQRYSGAPLAAAQLRADLMTLSGARA
ncbi:SCO family protein [Sphingomonas beigongshangi]|uniref:SCO family protein n=1 Tax=Sphingomonas beigongshangi TaxID=2782540 RepID=UPI00193B328E|nr:SCO family protein [Sphingomonas beigongshangi]